MSKISYEPIAYFKSSHTETYEAPRQGVLAQSATGVVELSDRFSMATCEDLEGFERVWLIYDFHQNETWKPKVRPPRFSEKKRSVFATRSPYRPNSIGMSCVKLDKIVGLKLHISEHDLLEGTPILDIKPYLPYADSFQDVSTGWVKNTAPYEISFSDQVKERLLWLEKNLKIDLKQTITNQLAYEPTCSKSKRVKLDEESYVFSIRTWRFRFIVFEQKVEIISIFSGYGDEELKSEKDPYLDKAVHKEFSALFN